jgi:hypothetical protein
MTFLGRRVPAGRQTSPVRLEAITVVDRDYKVDVYTSMSICWNNLARIDLFFDPYGEERITKDALRHKLETEGIVRVYDRDARGQAKWYWQFQLHK